MKTINLRKFLSLLLFVVVVSSLAACAGRPQQSDQSPSSQVEEEPEFVQFINTLPLPDSVSVGIQVPNFVDRVKEKHAINSDAVGWLMVPNTTLSDVVVWYPGDRNQFYYRRNFEKKTSFNGSYFADYRNKFEGNGAKGLSHNTVIYGHSMKDDPNSGLFSSLKHYLNIDFARSTPYVFFTTGGENLTWEVFAVFYTTVDLLYNRPDLDADVISESIKRSIYTYDTKISADDKILTLSTCTYSLPDGTKLTYPNNFRYVVMAKLVDGPTKTAAGLTPNPNPKAP